MSVVYSQLAVLVTPDRKQVVILRQNQRMLGPARHLRDDNIKTQALGYVCGDFPPIDFIGCMSELAQIIQTVAKVFSIPEFITGFLFGVVDFSTI